MMRSMVYQTSPSIFPKRTYDWLLSSDNYSMMIVNDNPIPPFSSIPYPAPVSQLGCCLGIFMLHVRRQAPGREFAPYLKHLGPGRCCHRLDMAGLTTGDPRISPGCPMTLETESSGSFNTRHVFMVGFNDVKQRCRMMNAVFCHMFHLSGANFPYLFHIFSIFSGAPYLSTPIKNGHPLARFEMTRNSP